ncbi:hypothetical protein BDY19DRAFT_512261 [Irpex rosettiformis]|uniref:Uncharacterized protein n=1 Tax=Irpex rosettiformis TaxID=378272 RepID=A0ACB8UET0_9APHY|nr:hypothetical protein BDY19DRAFT_512261 [Irpex rosettiformis]
MEDIALDPDIGPELMALLTQKVKTTREALNASLKDNTALREEIAKLREERDARFPKQEFADVQLTNVTCRIGQCKSKDEVESLRTQLTETTEKLEATEQVLEETNADLTNIKQKYERAKERYHECQETIQELQEQLRQITASIIFNALVRPLMVAHRINPTTSGLCSPACPPICPRLPCPK